MTKRAAKSKPAKAKPIREPTAAERRVMAEATARQTDRAPAVRLKIDQSGPSAVQFGPEHEDVSGWDAHLKETFGTSSKDFVTAATCRIEEVLRRGGAECASQVQINGALALMGAMAPANELEAALAEQVVASHTLSMHLLARANATSRADFLQTYGNLATKLQRTMAVQIEALAKLRSGGKQQVEVRYVYVDARGSQNIIAAGGGGRLDNPAQPHVPGLPFAPSVPVWSENPQGDGLPAAGHEGPEALPAPWGQEPGRTEGRG